MIEFHNALLCVFTSHVYPILYIKFLVSTMPEMKNRTSEKMSIFLLIYKSDEVKKFSRKKNVMRCDGLLEPTRKTELPIGEGIFRLLA